MKLDLITNKNDEYYTPEYAIHPILKYINNNSRVWCPFDLECSNYVKLLKNKGCEVINTHLSNGEDFFNIEVPKNINYIISNPPYTLKTEVFEKLFNSNIPFAMLVGVVGIFESKKRFNIFKNNDFEIMYFDKRISFFKNYNDQKPSINPPFSSVYICKGILPEKIIFENIIK